MSLRVLPSPYEQRHHYESPFGDGNNVVILSGDLNGDDGPGFANNADNSLHVVTATSQDLLSVPL